MANQRRYNPEAAKRDILRAAEELFVRSGFAKTSTAEIAKAAGVSASQINYHFGTKEQLWRTIHEEKFKGYFKVQVELLGGNGVGVDTVRKSMEAYFRFFQQEKNFARLMMWNLLEVGGMGHQDGSHLLALGSRLVATGQTRGLLRDDIDPALAMMAFLGIISWWFEGRDEFAPKLGLSGDPSDYDERYLDTVLKLICDGIAPRRE